MTINVATRRILISPTPILSPTDIPNCAFWIDYSDANTIFTDDGSTKVNADGQAIYRINDKTRSDKYLIQTTESKRPMYKTNIQNGLSVAQFIKANGSIMQSNVNYPKMIDVTLFMIIKSSVTDSDYILYLGSNNDAVIQGYVSGKYEWYATPRVVIGSISTSIFQNINTNEARTFTNSTNLFRLGGDAIDDRDNFSGYIGEILLYDAELSTEKMSLINNYLNNKWGL